MSLIARTFLRYRRGFSSRQTLRPRRDLGSIPEAAALTLTADRLGEAAHLGDLARPLMAHAEEFGDLA